MTLEAQFDLSVRNRQATEANRLKHRVIHHWVFVPNHYGDPGQFRLEKIQIKNRNPKIELPIECVFADDFDAGDRFRTTFTFTPELPVIQDYHRPIITKLIAEQASMSLLRLVPYMPWGLDPHEVTHFKAGSRIPDDLYPWTLPQHVLNMSIAFGPDGRQLEFTSSIVRTSQSEEARKALGL